MSQQQLPDRSPIRSPWARLLIVLGLPPFVLSALATFEAASLSFHSVLGRPLLSPTPWITFPLASLLALAAWWSRGRRRLAVTFALLSLASLATSFFPIYPPTAPFAWLLAFRDTPWARPLAIHLTATLLALGAVMIAVFRGPRSNDRIHGSSRFASFLEVQRAGLFAPAGIHLGRLGSRKVRHAGDEHVLAVMPTGAGKTTSYLIPSLLTMTEDSIVVADIKGAEIFTATAGARVRTHRVIRFEPTADWPTADWPTVDWPTGGSLTGGSESAPTACWNPLDEVPRDSGDVAALQRQATNLIVPDRFGRETHWHRAARELYVLLALHVIYSRDHTSSIGALRRLLLASSPPGTEDASSTGYAPSTAEPPSPSALFARILRDTHTHHGHGLPQSPLTWRDPDSGTTVFKHPEVTNLATRFQATERRELSSIISTLATFLEPWADARLDRATSRSDFSLADVAPGTTRRPVALYIVVPRHDLARLSPLLRLFYGSFAALVCQATRFKDWKARPAARRRRTYVFLDEFPMLGYMPVFGDMLATLRGYGATLFIVAQDLAQLRNIYGANEPITGGCPFFLTAGSQRPETLRHISALAGDTTVVWDRSGQSTSGGGLFGRRSRSKSGAEARRPLLTTGEVRTLDAAQALLFAPGLHPISLTKAPYFHDRALRKLAAIEPPTEANTFESH